MAKIAKRRGLMIRLFFLIAICGMIVLGLHFYMYIYKGNADERLTRTGLLSRSKMPQTSEGVVSVFSNVFGQSSERSPRKDARSQLKEKIVHLDLKGMPLSFVSYKRLFPFLKQIGVTGVLMEYEDMFPYQDKLKPLTNKKAYTKNEIREILEFAKASQLQVIPLIQTFGHLEFMLKLEPFADLREVKRYPQVICPTNNRSQIVLKDMIHQVLTLHPDIKYIHIGSDEVYHIGKCPLCQDRMAKDRIDESQLFLDHVASIAQFVKSRYHVQPLMWDDEFRKLDKQTIVESGLGDLVELIVWNYHDDVEYRIDRPVWEKYSQIFKSVWIGSSFKGANKPNTMMVNETFYLENHFSWVKTMNQYSDIISYKGIFLTGWQRYDHFSVLCEILPSGIPSLVSCMTFLNLNGRVSVDEILSNTSSYLDCESRLNYCDFFGSKVHQEIIQLQMYKDAFKRLQEKNVYLGWAQDINIKYEFSNPSHVEPVFQEVTALYSGLGQSKTLLEKSLQDIFPEWTIVEWMETHFNPVYKQLGNLYDGLLKIVDRQIYPVRPFEIDKELTMKRTLN